MLISFTKNSQNFTKNILDLKQFEQGNMKSGTKINELEY